MKNCKNCGLAIFDEKWGEFKCLSKERRCTEDEVKNGCVRWSKKKDTKNKDSK